MISIIMVSSCPVDNPLHNIYEKGNRKPFNPRNTNWRTVFAISTGFPWFFTSLIPELSFPKSTKPVMVNPSSSGWNCTPDWIVISSNIRPPISGDSVLSSSLYIHCIKLWFIPGSFSRLFLYFLIEISLSIYKSVEISLYDLGLVMHKLMAKEMMSLGHLWPLPSFPFFRSHKHLDWKRMSWVKRSGQSGKYSYNTDSGIMDSCGSGSEDSSILSFIESLEEFVLNWVILTDKHFGHNRPLDVRGTYPKQSLDFLP